MKEIKSHDRLHDVQFKLAVFNAERNRHIVANNLIAGLIQHFGDNGIHLARHNRRPGLTGRHVQFMKAASRSGRHKAYVVCHFNQYQRRRFHASRYVGKYICIIRGIDHIAGRNEHFPRQLRQLRRGQLAVFRFGVQPCADSGAAHIDNMHVVQRRFDSPAGAANGGRIGGHFLS